jgi:hypothetical protein
MALSAETPLAVRVQEFFPPDTGAFHPCKAATVRAGCFSPESGLNGAQIQPIALVWSSIEYAGHGLLLAENQRSLSFPYNLSVV